MSMKTYRAVWMLLMVFLMAPAFLMASGMEGVGFQEGASYTFMTLQSYGVPGFLAEWMAYPVTIVATLIPGTSSLVALMGDTLFTGLGMVFMIAFLVFVEPPFYRSSSEAPVAV